MSTSLDPIPPPVPGLPPASDQPLTTHQAMMVQALACEIAMSPAQQHDGIRQRFSAMSQDQGVMYLHQISERIKHGRRVARAHPAAAAPAMPVVVPAAPAALDAHRGSAGLATPAAPAQRSPSRPVAAVVMLLLLASTSALAYVHSPIVVFALVLVALIAATAAGGVATLGMPLGALINERNVVSLSRFQALIWTIVIVAAYLAFVLTRLAQGNDHALSVTISDEQWQLLALMGISGTSLVAAPMILNATKGDIQPAAGQDDKAATRIQDPQISGATVANSRTGLLYGNPRPEDARLADLIEGDEVATTTRVDLAKMQLLYVTMISVIGFALAVVVQLAKGNLDALPGIPSWLLALTGISHGSYLVNKSITSTPKATST